jgi:branched-chain amino acid transport system permease protein
LLGLGELSKAWFANLTGGAAPGVDLVVFGVLLIVSVAFAPQGLMGLVRALRVPGKGSA